MDKYVLQKLRDLPIEGVAERLGLHVARHKCLCPFHEDSHPSLTFKVSKNTCRCYVCMMQSMGPIDLVMRHLGKNFKEACRWLADEHNVIISDDRFKVQGEGVLRYRSGEQSSEQGSSNLKPQPSSIIPQTSFDASRYERFFEHPWLNEEARRFLFEERRLDPRVVSWCRLTSWTDRQGIAWLQIPYYDRDGKLVGVQNRRLSGSGLMVQGSGLTVLRYRSGEQSSEKGEGLTVKGEGLMVLRYRSGEQSSEKGEGLTVKGEGLMVLRYRSGEQSSEKGEGDSDNKLSTINYQLSINKDCQLSINQPRFRFPRGSQCGIYNLPVLNLLKPGDELYITEGCSDCWAMLSNGHKAIAIPSATLLTQKDIEQLSSLNSELSISKDSQLSTANSQLSITKDSQLVTANSQLSITFHMYPDRDAPGERLFLYLQQVLPNLVHHQLPQGCKDYSEYFVKSKE